MARQQKDFTYDNALLLKDTGAISADAAAQVGGSARVLTLGAGRMDGRVIVDVSALDVVTGDESHVVATQFSNSPTFASGVVGGTMLRLGGATALVGESAASVAGRYELPCTNEINGVIYSYMRLYTDVSGTTPSITYTAFLTTEA